MKGIPFAKYNWIALSYRGANLDTPGFDEYIVKALQMGANPSIFLHSDGVLVVTWLRKPSVDA